MLLSVITINYKTKDATLSCIQSLQKTYKTAFEKGEIEHIIVDNDSGDDSVSFLKKEITQEKFHHVSVVANKTNEGFGKGCNKGSRSAKGKYLLFLNSDTSVISNALFDMVDFCKQNPKTGIVGGELIFPNGKTQLSAWKFYTPLNAFFMLLGLQKFGLLNEVSSFPKQVDWVTGACMMVKKETFLRLGMFDEHIFMYMEDMDLCFTAKKKGYLTYYFPQFVVKHSAQGSSNRTFAIVNIYKNLLYFYKKHMTSSQYMMIKLLLQTKAVFLILYGKTFRKSFFITTYEEALKATG